MFRYESLLNWLFLRLFFICSCGSHRLLFVFCSSFVRLLFVFCSSFVCLSFICLCGSHYLLVRLALSACAARTICLCGSHYLPVWLAPLLTWYYWHFWHYGIKLFSFYLLAFWAVLNHFLKIFAKVQKKYHLTKKYSKKILYLCPINSNFKCNEDKINFRTFVIDNDYFV